MSRTMRDSNHPWYPYAKGPRDKKPWWKPPSDFKKMKQAIRRAKAKQALREMIIPEEFINVQFKKKDMWDWN